MTESFDPSQISYVAAMDAVREVYGIRRIEFNETERTVRVEFDASRLSDDVVAKLLKQTGLDVREKLALA